jgi:hypothetical protein
MKNWKTTLAGIIVGGEAAATALGWITVEVGQSILGIAAAVGLILAKDGSTIK